MLLFCALQRLRVVLIKIAVTFALFKIDSQSFGKLSWSD